MLVEPREQRDGVAPERKPERADPDRTAAAHPGEHTPQIPDRLRFGVHRVHQIPGQKAPSTAAPNLSRAVQRQHRKYQVQAQATVEFHGAEGREIEQGRAHAKAVDTH